MTKFKPKIISTTLVLLCLLFASYHAKAQNNSNTYKLLISSRVDTSIKDVKSVINCYENYLNSNPDSIYNNPYWNTKEKNRYKDFDFSRSSLFQGNMNAATLFKYFSPFVMSVEPINDKYQIRVLYSSATTDPKYASSKVWCIHKLSAIKEDGHWVLENLMVDITKKWQNQKFGCVNFVYPESHSFKQSEAKKSEAFCKKIINRFNPDYSDTFSYYITNSTDDMGLLENFDYYFVGITTGKAREGMVLSSLGNEFYPHEFVHQLLPKNQKRGKIIEEGLAVFLGTKESKTEYQKLMKSLASDLNSQPDKINFESVLTQKISFNGYQTAYPAGAAICEIIYQLKGDEGLLKLMLTNTQNYQELLRNILRITKLSETEFKLKWKMKLKSYLLK